MAKPNATKIGCVKIPTILCTEIKILFTELFILGEVAQHHPASQFIAPFGGSWLDIGWIAWIKWLYCFRHIIALDSSGTGIAGCIKK